MSAGAGLEDRRGRGVGLILCAYLCFTGIDTCAKWLAEAGLPLGQIAAVRFAGQLLIVSALFLPRDPALFVSANPRMAAIRGLCLACGTLFNFAAVRHLPLTVTSAIFFTVPLIVCALSAPLLGEKVGPRRWAAIAVGFGGVLIVTRPWGAEAHWAALLSLGAATSASLYVIATRRMAGVDAASTQQAWGAAIGFCAAAPLALGGWAWPAAAPDWIAFALLGAFGLAGHQLLTVAHRYAPASALAPYVYLQIAFMAASSWAVFDDPPDGWTFVGATVVVASGLYVWLRERRLADG